MSIKADVQELESIRAEIKSLNMRRKQLRDKEKIVETRIQDYLRAKNQPGVKHQGTAIIMEEKETRSSKKSKERDTDAMNVLERYGVRDAEKVLKEIMEARKGEPVPKTKLKISKYKNQDY